MAHSDFIFLCHFCLVYKSCLWPRQTDNVKQNTQHLNRQICTCVGLGILERTLPSYWKKATPIYSSGPSLLGASRQLVCSGNCPGVGIRRLECEFQFSRHLLGDSDFLMPKLLTWKMEMMTTTHAFHNCEDLVICRAVLTLMELLISGVWYSCCNWEEALVTLFSAAVTQVDNKYLSPDHVS